MLLDLAKKVNGGGFWGAGGPFAVHVKTLAARGLVAHMDAANACGLVYCGSSSIFGHGGGLLLGIFAARIAASTGVLLVPPVRLTTMVKAAG
jgi:hypothetical protein